MSVVRGQNGQTGWRSKKNNNNKSEIHWWYQGVCRIATLSTQHFHCWTSWRRLPLVFSTSEIQQCLQKVPDRCDGSSGCACHVIGQTKTSVAHPFPHRWSQLITKRKVFHSNISANEVGSTLPASCLAIGIQTRTLLSSFWWLFAPGWFAFQQYWRKTSWC